MYKIVEFGSIGQSLGGLEIPIVKVTKTELIPKPIVIVLGRQHPGITYSSFVIHGFLNYIMSNEVLANKLREKYEFWVIPMLNPDGVVVGNYKYNIQGRDLNRVFYHDDDDEAYNN